MSITLIAVALFLIFVFPALVDLVVDALPVSNKQAALDRTAMDDDCPF